MSLIRPTDLAQELRDMTGLDLTEEQIIQIRDRALRYDGHRWTEAVTPDEFWIIVRDVDGGGAL